MGTTGAMLEKSAEEGGRQDSIYGVSGGTSGRPKMAGDVRRCGGEVTPWRREGVTRLEGGGNYGGGAKHRNPGRSAPGAMRWSAS